jgi:TonB-linked SusC/RagA family outer membrane protein
MKKVIKIYISLTVLVLSCINSSYAQNQTTKGRLINEAGKPIANAKVSVLEKNISTLTDPSGYFTLDVSKEDLKLKMEAGLTKQLFDLKKNGSDYILKDYYETLNWGLGQEKKIHKNSAAISTIQSKSLEKFSVINPGNSLYGRLTGLMVLQNGVLPWSRNPKMFVRGIETMGNKTPLVLIDGIERPINAIVIDDIESVSVLKDAAALSIYGMRGANGAIVVTTKRGNNESFSVDATYTFGLNTAFRLPNMLDAYNFAQASNEASALDGNPFKYNKWDLQEYKDGSQPYYSPNVDWMKECLNDYAVTTNFNSQFRGGGKSVRYYSSINYQKEEGLFKNTNIDSRYNSQLKFSKFNVRANIDADITATTLVSVNLNASLEDRNYPNAGVPAIMNRIYNTPANAFPVKNSDGTWGGTDIYSQNPVAMIAATGYRSDFQRQLLGDLTIKQDLNMVLSGLSAEVTVAYDNSATLWEGSKKTYEYSKLDFQRNAETGEITDVTQTVLGRESDLEKVDEGTTQWRRGTLRGTLNYRTNWQNSTLNTSVIYTQDKYVQDKQYNTWLRQNVATHVAYAYKNKYLADFSLSYSGSSNLEKNDRFGIFPALSLGWIISKEAFMQSNAINLLKLRASYGLTGSDYMTQNLFDQKFTNGGKYYFGKNYSANTGIKAGQLATKNLIFEKSYKANLGVDAIVLNYLNLKADAFYNRRENILVGTGGNISSVLGAETAQANDGEVENKGIEIDLSWNKNSGDFQYYVGANATWSKNKIINQNEQYRPYDYLKRTGQVIGQTYGLEAIGFFADEADIKRSPTQSFSPVRPGDIKYKDQNKDGKIDANDEIAIGYSSMLPELYYGINLGFNYKGFGVDVVFQGIARHTLYLNSSSIFMPLKKNTNISEFSANRWVPQNKEAAELPRLSMEANDNNYRKNSIWLEDGDYLKLRTLNVYYDVPDNWMNKLKLKRGKIFLRGMNLLSIDNINIVDPENIGTTYPTLSSYHIGISLGF